MKDLVVDMEGFFAKFRSVQPFLQSTTRLPPERERRQSARDRARYDDTTKCILCAACTTSCPSFWARPEYVGPAAIVNAHRFIFDSRDDAAEERLEILADKDGVWRCRTIFNCVGRLPARHPHHPGDPRGLLGDRGTAGLSEPGEAAGPEAVTLPVIPHLVIRTDGAARGNPGPASLGAALIDGSRAGRPGSRRAPGRHRSPRRSATRPTTWPSGPASCEALKLAQRAGRREGGPAPGLQADRGAAPRPLAGQGRQAPAAVGRGEWRMLGRLPALVRDATCRGPRTATADRLANEALDRVAAGGPPRRRDPARLTPRRSAGSITFAGDPG